MFAETRSNCKFQCHLEHLFNMGHFRAALGVVMFGRFRTAIRLRSGSFLVKTTASKAIDLLNKTAFDENTNTAERENEKKRERSKR